MLTTDRVQKILFQCITEAFKYFNGVPKELLFDNMSTVVDRSGTTFKAVAIGVAAAKKRNMEYFISCHDLIMQLNKSHAQNRLETKLKHYAKYRLLIIDEIGYLPIDKQ